MLLEDVHPMHDHFKAPFSRPRHKVLGLVCFKHPWDELHWLSNRTYWNGMIEPDVRIQTNLKYFFCWHQVKFHEMSRSRSYSPYLPLPALCAIPEAAIWHVSNLLTYPISLFVAYQTYKLQPDVTQRLSWLSWQMLVAERTVLYLMAFLDITQYGVEDHVREAKYRILSALFLPSPEGRLVLLERHLTPLIRELSVQNIAQKTNYGVEEAKALLDYVLQIDLGEILRLSLVRL